MPLKSGRLHTLSPGTESQNGTLRVKSLFFNLIDELCTDVGLASGLPLGTGADRTARTQKCPRKGAVPGDLYMLKMNGPASESQKNMVLVVCLLVMSVMCIGLIWQAQIISNQREDIKWLQTLKFGG
jgi:hypothetical protein